MIRFPEVSVFLVRILDFHSLVCSLDFFFWVWTLDLCRGIILWKYTSVINICVYRSQGQAYFHGTQFSTAFFLSNV